MRTPWGLSRLVYLASNRKNPRRGEMFADELEYWREWRDFARECERDGFGRGVILGFFIGLIIGVLTIAAAA